MLPTYADQVFACRRGDLAKGIIKTNLGDFVTVTPITRRVRYGGGGGGGSCPGSRSVMAPVVPVSWDSSRRTPSLWRAAEFTAALIIYGRVVYYCWNQQVGDSGISMGFDRVGHGWIWLDRVSYSSSPYV